MESFIGLWWRNLLSGAGALGAYAPTLRSGGCEGSLPNLPPHTTASSSSPYVPIPTCTSIRADLASPTRIPSSQDFGSQPADKMNLHARPCSNWWFVTQHRAYLQYLRANSIAVSTMPGD